MPALSVDAATIRDRFNIDWAMDPENGAGQDTWWWYAVSVRVDPNEVIADDGEGHLWSVSFTTDGEDQVAFGEPVRVRQTFVPVEAGEGQAATAAVRRRRQSTLAAAMERPDKGDHGDRAVPSQYQNPGASASTTRQEATSMPIDMDALRSRLGLDEDATEEQINEALASEQPETFTREQVDQQVAAAREEAAAAASAAEGDTVRFDRAAAEQLRADAAAGRQAREQQIATERDQIVASAVEEGRIPPARRAHWRTLLDADPEGTASTLESLERGLIPVTQRGVSTDPDGEAGSASVAYTDDDGHLADGVSLLTPAERARQRA